jgi:hypothetical protein
MVWRWYAFLASHSNSWFLLIFRWWRIKIYWTLSPSLSYTSCSGRVQTLGSLKFSSRTNARESFIKNATVDGYRKNDWRKRTTFKGRVRVCVLWCGGAVRLGSCLAPNMRGPSKAKGKRWEYSRAGEPKEMRGWKKADNRWHWKA